MFYDVIFKAVTTLFAILSPFQGGLREPSPEFMLTCDIVHKIPAVSVPLPTSGARFCPDTLLLPDRHLLAFWRDTLDAEGVAHAPLSGKDSFLVPLIKQRSREGEVHASMRPDLNLFGLWQGFSGYTPNDHQATFSTLYSVGLRLAWRLDLQPVRSLKHPKTVPSKSMLKAIHGSAAERPRAYDTFER